MTTLTTTRHAPVTTAKMSLKDLHTQLHGEQQPTPSADTQRLLAHLHSGGNHRFTQNLSGKTNSSVWSRVDEPLKLPALDGNENLFFSVNPSVVRVTDADRTKYPGKPDNLIEQWVTSKNSTIAAINTLYSEFDGKDFTGPTEADIDAQVPIVAQLDADRIAAARAANPTAHLRPQSAKALRNQAEARAKDACYKLAPQQYNALAAAHIAQLQPAPSVIVFSGGGYQCYWLLAKPLAISSHPDDHSAHVQSYAADLQARWVAFTGGDPGVKDLRRILRLPGFFNHKKKYAPDFPLVSFVKADFENVYDLGALAKFAPPEPTAKPRPAPNQRRVAKLQADSAALHTAASESTDGQPTVIGGFNADMDIREILEHYGYTRQGDRMIRPGGDSASVQINSEKNSSYHHSSSDPLANGHLRTPFDVYCEYEHGGNINVAVDALAKGFFGALRLAVRQNNFEDFVPNPLGDVYRGDPSDTKVATAILVVMEKTRRLSIKTSFRRLMKLAGLGSHHTVQKALLRLNGWFINLKLDMNGNGCWISLIPNCRLHKSAHIGFSTIFKRGHSSANDIANDIYTEKMGTEPFLTGTTRYIKEQARNIAGAVGISVVDALRDYTFRAFGEAGLRVIDALQRAGDMTAIELTEETGKKLSSIRRAAQYLEKRGVIEATREGSRGPNTYSLVPDHWKVIEDLAPNLRTYTLTSQRENKRLEKTQVFAAQAIEFAQENGDQAYEAKMRMRYESLAKRRLPHLRRLHDDLPAEDIKALAYDIEMPSYDHPAVQAKLQRLHEKARAETRGNGEQAVVTKVAAENQGFMASVPTRQKLEYLHRASKSDVVAQRRIDMEAASDELKTVVFGLRDDAIKAVKAMKGKGRGKWGVRAIVRQNLGYMGYTRNEVRAAMKAAGLA